MRPSTSYRKPALRLSKSFDLHLKISVAESLRKSPDLLCGGTIHAHRIEQMLRQTVQFQQGAKLAHPDLAGHALTTQVGLDPTAYRPRADGRPSTAGSLSAYRCRSPIPLRPAVNFAQFRAPLNNSTHSTTATCPACRVATQASNRQNTPVTTFCNSAMSMPDVPPTRAPTGILRYATPAVKVPVALCATAWHTAWHACCFS